MQKTQKDRVRIEKRKHVVNTYDKACYGCYSIGDNIDFGEIQGQDGQKSWRGQTEGRIGVVVEEMQRVQIQLATKGEWTPIGKQRKDNHPGIFPMQIAEVVLVLWVQGLSDPNVGHKKEHHQIDGDHTESVAFRDGHVLDEGEGQIGKGNIPVEQRPDFVLEHKKQDEHQKRQGLEKDVELTQMSLWRMGKCCKDHLLDVLRVEISADDRQQNRLRRQQNDEKPPLG
jgi:hypothetical protein